MSSFLKLNNLYNPEYCVSLSKNWVFKKIQTSTIYTRCSTFQARNVQTGETVAIKKMSYGGKQSHLVSRLLTRIEFVFNLVEVYVLGNSSS